MVTAGVELQSVFLIKYNFQDKGPNKYRNKFRQLWLAGKSFIQTLLAKKNPESYIGFQGLTLTRFL